MNKRFKRYLTRFNRPFAEAVTKGYKAIFEAGLSPQKKTRRALRSILPEPPGGWDSPAITDEGKPFTSRSGNTLTWNQVLETYLRGLFFHDPKVADKFEPGAARIAYTELGVWPPGIQDFRSNPTEERDIAQFRSILRMLSGNEHVNEYDFDLNGLTYENMERRFGRNAKDSAVDDTEDTGTLNYEIVHIPDFETSEEYGKYTNRWCICYDNGYWNRYTRKNNYTVYFLFAPGFRELNPRTKGDDYPRDEYALSVIGAVIGPEGDLEYCCLRRNHDGGLGDHELDEKTLSGLLGRPMRTVLPYVEPANKPNVIANIKKRILAGESPEAVYGGDTNQLREVFNSVYSYKTSAGLILVNTKTWLPICDLAFDYIDKGDERCCMGTLVDSDDYGDDIHVSYLVRPDGTYYVLSVEEGVNASDYDIYLVDREITDFRPVASGYYTVAVLDDDFANGFIMHLPESGAPKIVSEFHSDITWYGSDQVFVCDPDSESWNNRSDRGDPEIIAISGDGYHVILGNSATGIGGKQPDSTLFTYEYDDGKRVNVFYISSNHTGIFLHGGKLREMKELDIISCEYLATPGPDAAFIDAVDAGDDSHMIISLVDGTVHLSGLEEPPNSIGVYKTPTGKYNALSTDSGILPKDYASVDYQYDGIFPIFRKYRLGVYRCSDDGGRSSDIYNIPSSNFPECKKIYPVALPKDVGPFSDNLLIKVAKNGKDHLHDTYILVDLEGNPKSPVFDIYDPYTDSLLIGNRRIPIDVNTGFRLGDEDADARIPTKDDGVPETNIYRIGEIPVKNKELYSVYRITNANKKSTAFMRGEQGWIKNSMGWHDLIVVEESNARLVLCKDSTTKSLGWNGVKCFDLLLNKFAPWEGDELKEKILSNARALNPVRMEQAVNKLGTALVTLAKLDNWIETDGEPQNLADSNDANWIRRNEQ